MQEIQCPQNPEKLGSWIEEIKEKASKELDNPESVLVGLTGLGEEYDYSLVVICEPGDKKGKPISEDPPRIVYKPETILGYKNYFPSYLDTERFIASKIMPLIKDQLFDVYQDEN